MADRFLNPDITMKEPSPVPESVLKKIQRKKEIKAKRKISLKCFKNMRKNETNKLKLRTLKYDKEYKKAEKQKIKLIREAKSKGGFYKEPENKIIFVIRLKGINKLAPKPRNILKLFRLRQLHNGVFIKVNKATTEMLKAIQPFVTYGYPSLKIIRKLLYKRGYAKIGSHGNYQRIRIQNNELIAKHLGKYGIKGIEDIIHELYTCGPHFKQVNNFLWPFKLSSPRKGFVCKRHGFNEPLGGDWGNREELINKLLRRMI